MENQSLIPTVKKQMEFQTTINNNILRARINRYCSVQRAKGNAPVPEEMHLITDAEAKAVAESLNDTIDGLIETGEDWPIEKIVAKILCNLHDAEAEVKNLMNVNEGEKEE